MNLRRCPALVLCALLLPIAPARPADLPTLPLPVDQSRSATARRLAKPVLATRPLDGMEAPTNWVHFGVGAMSFTGERVHDGRQALRLTAPTKTDQANPVTGRPFAEAGVRREFGGDDWSGFNRVSFWVYPELPGFRVVSLLVKLQSEGTQGRSYTDGGLHHVLLTNQVWNHVVWEIPHLDRRQVRSLELIYRLQGNEPEATDRVCFDFDQLELQRVEPDPFLGWAVAPGEVAYNHLGYRPAAAKVALFGGPATGRFQVLDATSQATVLEPAVTAMTTPLGEFARVDFSALRQPGRYRLRIGGVTSEPFTIAGDPWRETVLATLNLFYCQRCGWEVPGIHGICHRDWQAKHGDQRILINGGWHDAGDLSQGLVNTAEAAYSLLRLATALRERDPLLATRLATEARWGLDWMLKTRFGDGFRLTWATMDFWTDGILGTVDDVVFDANNSPFENFLSAATEARAAQWWNATDPILAAHARRIAEADWRFGLAKTREPNVELAAAGAQASLELFRATQRTEFADQAVKFANVLLDSQATQVPAAWPLPLSGFFYRSPQRDAPLHYSHRSHEQAPVMALADLCEVLPDRPEQPRWRAAVALYAKYLAAAAAATAPYHMLPAGIYRVDQGAEWEREQARQGLRLDERHYLRRFPAWPDFRGNLGVQLSQTLALARAARLLDEVTLRGLVQDQLDWVLGRNPFCQSLMYGVGHNYAPQYTAMSGDITGSLPVGIQSRLDGDEPYWPASNCYNYAELWVHPSSRWLGVMAEVAADPHWN